MAAQVSAQDPGTHTLWRDVSGPPRQATSWLESRVTKPRTAAPLGGLHLSSL